MFRFCALSLIGDAVAFVTDPSN